MLDHADYYRHYVEHPRFGRSPRLTGFNPQDRIVDGFSLNVHWNASECDRIPNTAILAEPSRQVPDSYGGRVAYYYDVRRVCRDCGHHFIFFAEEQKHWYEELGFRLEVDCVRCVPCRRKRRESDRWLTRYHELVAHDPPAPSRCLELAKLTADLIEAGEFPAHPRTFARARMWLNRVGTSGSAGAELSRLRERLRTMESRPSP